MWLPRGFEEGRHFTHHTDGPETVSWAGDLLSAGCQVNGFEFYCLRQTFWTLSTIQFSHQPHSFCDRFCFYFLSTHAGWTVTFYYHPTHTLPGDRPWKICLEQALSCWDLFLNHIVVNILRPERLSSQKVSACPLHHSLSFQKKMGRGCY